jgi:hypothetical protein
VDRLLWRGVLTLGDTRTGVGEPAQLRERGHYGAVSGLRALRRRRPDQRASAVRACNTHPTKRAFLQLSWNALYAAHAEVVLNGHDRQLRAVRSAEPERNVRHGEGHKGVRGGNRGTSLRPVGTVKSNSRVHNANTHRVLKLTLHATSYEWEFVPVSGKNFTDSGSTACH